MRINYLLEERLTANGKRLTEEWMQSKGKDSFISSAFLSSTTGRNKQSSICRESDHSYVWGEFISLLGAI